MLQKEISQIKQTGLNCYKYGFFSKTGFEDTNESNLILYTLDDLFKEI